MVLLIKNRHSVYLDSKQEDFLEEIIERKNLGALNSTSKLMRFIIEDYHNLITKKTNPDVRLNYISKEISMILNLVASISHTLNVTHMTNENVVQYWQAKQEVERLINHNRWRKGYRRKSKKPSAEIQAKLSEKKIDESYYDQFGVGFSKKGNDSFEKSLEEMKLEIEQPSFLSHYNYNEASDEDYVEVSTNDWIDSKF